MKKTIYLHVGPHKTGTTVIQKACLDNSSILNDYDISYPPVFFNHIGHHGLVNVVRSRQLTDEKINALKNCNSKILLSSENFIHFNKDDLQYVRDRFKNFNFEIIYAWRRSSMKMYSVWQETVKQGSSIPFHEFYYEDLIKPGQSKLLSQIKNIDLYANQFGKTNIHIIDYDATFKEGVLVDEFFNLVGVDRKAINVSNQAKGIKNESLEPAITEILRCLNNKSSHKGLPENSETREAFFEFEYLFLDEIVDIKKLMSDYIIEVTFGDYMVDKATENAIYEKYKNNIIGYQNHTDSKKIRIISPNWLLNLKSAQLIDAIYSKIYQGL